MALRDWARLRKWWSQGNLAELLEDLERLHEDEPDNFFIELSLDYARTRMFGAFGGKLGSSDLRLICDLDVLEKVDLSPLERELVNRVNGLLSAAEVTATFVGREPEAMRALVGLVESHGLMIISNPGMPSPTGPTRHCDHLNLPDSERFEHYLNQAVTACQARKYPQAERLLELCLSMRPEDKRVAYNLAAVRKKWNQALLA